MLICMWFYVQFYKCCMGEIDFSLTKQIMDDTFFFADCCI